MVDLQELIQNGRVEGVAARGILRDISLNNVTDVQSEIRTRNLPNGRIYRYTVLTFTLDGTELLVTGTSSANAEHYLGDRTAVKTTRPHRMNDQSSMSEQTPSNDIEAFKRLLDIEANEALQRQLDAHNEVHKKRAERSAKNYSMLLHKTLHVIRAESDAFHHGNIGLYVTDKLAAKILANNPKIFAEYQEACEQSLKEYRADLKRQYRGHLNNIELECRDWLKANAGSNLNIGALDGLTNAITQATQFEAPLPVINKSVADRFTKDILEADRVEKIAEFTELASKPVEEGGLSLFRESVQLKPLFSNHPEPNVGRNASMKGVPATLLPMYQRTSSPSANQASAALSIIDRNNSSRPVQPTASSSFGGNGLQAQGPTSQNHFTNHFTPINRPYISPYAVLPPRQSEPASVPSSDWYDPTNRSQADRSQPSSPVHSAIPSTQDTAHAFASQNQTRGGGSFEQKTNYPAYPTYPRAGVFNLPTISQPTPRRISPTLISPARQLEESMNEANEFPNIPRPVSAISTSNIASIPRRIESSLVETNTYVDTSLYDADYDEEYDENYAPPPASTTPQQSKPYQYFKTEPRQTQPRHNMTSLRLHSPPTPPGPFLNDALRSQFDDGRDDFQDYEQSDGGDLPDYNDFDEAEADTSRYLTRAPIQRARDVISISSDDQEGGGDEDEEDNYEDEVVQGSSNRGRVHDDPHGPVSNSYATESSFGAHIDDPHASDRDVRPFFTNSKSLSLSQSQNQTSNLKREESAIPANDPGSVYARWGNILTASGQRVNFQQRFRGKTVSQVMQLLKAEEAKKRKRGADGDEGDGVEYDDGAGERAAKRIWHVERMG